MQPSLVAISSHAAGRMCRRLTRPAAVAALATAVLGLPVMVPSSAGAHAGGVHDPGAAAVGEPRIPRLPAPTGPHRVGTVAAHLVDPSRPDPLMPANPARELMVQLWYPAASIRGHRPATYLPVAAARELAAGTGLPVQSLAVVRTSGHEGAPVRPGHRRLPVVLYSPGLGFPRAFGTTLVQDLASHGFLIVAVDHTYDAAVVQFPGGRVERGVSPDPLVALRTRVDDIRFVLRRLTQINAGRVVPGFRDRLDLTRIGMVGHSLGGATAANAIAARLPIRAGLNMDGSVLPPAGDPGIRIRRPFLQFGSGRHNRFTDPTWAAFWTNLHGWRRELQIGGTGHLDFTDLGLLLDQLGVDRHTLFPGAFGSVPPARAVTIQQTYVRAFFTEHLRGRQQRLLDRPSARFPELIFVGVAAGESAAASWPATVPAGLVSGTAAGGR
jgi:predicted dienelactone hydrolase